MTDAFAGFAWVTTWKGIAKFCGVSVDTVRRWEKQFALPVMRLPSKTGLGPGLVTALPSELNTWLREFSDSLERSKIERAKRKAADRASRKAAESNNGGLPLH